MSYVFYEPDIAGRYIRWMAMPQFDAMTNGFVAAMYLFAPVGAVVAFLIGRFGLGDRLTPRFRRAAQVAGFAALALLASRLVALRFDTSGWIYADYLREDGRPARSAGVAGAVAGRERTGQVSDAVHALARTGRLPWEMFHYPQLASSDALLLRDTT